MVSQLSQGVLVSWSGGKDSCMALYEIQQAQQHDVLALLTTITAGYDRISMHGVRRILLERQANSLGLPLKEIIISQNATNEEYERKFLEAVTSFDSRAIDSIVFGDLFLEDVKQYRDALLARNNLR